MPWTLSPRSAVYLERAHARMIETIADPLPTSL